jgi:hypothetical protein
MFPRADACYLHRAVAVPRIPNVRHFLSRLNVMPESPLHRPLALAH